MRVFFCCFLAAVRRLDYSSESSDDSSADGDDSADETDSALCPSGGLSFSHRTSTRASSIPTEVAVQSGTDLNASSFSVATAGSILDAVFFFCRSRFRRTGTDYAGHHVAGHRRRMHPHLPLRREHPPEEEPHPHPAGSSCFVFTVS